MDIFHIVYSPNSLNCPEKSSFINFILTNVPHKYSTASTFVNDISDHCKPSKTKHDDEACTICAAYDHSMRDYCMGAEGTAPLQYPIYCENQKSIWPQDSEADVCQKQWLIRVAVQTLHPPGEEGRVSWGPHSQKDE